MSEQKTAIVIGATGLVGKQLVEILLQDDSFSTIKLFVRRSTGYIDTRIEEYVINFDNLEFYKSDIVGDVLFSCMGTTIKQAGTKAEQYKVDYTYQYEMAKLAAENKVPVYELISASGAAAKSMFFYPRIKGELDDAISKLPFPRIRIFRPSILLGNRTEKRMGEQIGASVMEFMVKKIPPLQKYRGIPAEVVAQAMVNAFKAENQERLVVYKLDEIFEV